MKSNPDVIVSMYFGEGARLRAVDRRHGVNVGLLSAIRLRCRSVQWIRFFLCVALPPICQTRLAG